MKSQLLLASLFASLLAPQHAASAQRADHSPRAVVADSGSPEWVVEMFYAQPTFPHKAQYLTGEFAARYADAPTMGSRTPRSVAVTSRPLLVESDRAVYATSLRDASHAQDWYTYLRRERGIWKLDAVRTLSLPPIHYVLLDSMEARRRHGALPDSLIPVAESMRLAIRSDSALRRYVPEHEAALRALAERFAAIRGVNAVTSDGETFPANAVPSSDRSALVTSLRALRLGAVLRFPDRPHCVFLKIGGDGDNYVGFLYAPTGCTPPALSPYEYIYVENAAPGWFVYKTT